MPRLSQDGSGKAVRLYFSIGTVAEFIKLMPVLRELTAERIPFKVISTGQNRLVCEELFPYAGIEGIDLVLNRREVRKSVAGLLMWFMKTLIQGYRILRREFHGLDSRSVLVVHGDTVSTVMGAFLGRCFGLTVAHVEAGLRSFNLLQPFPEEIDRRLTAYFADFHFCPDSTAVANLQKRRGTKIDTKYNTNIDSLDLALLRTAAPVTIERLQGREYFIFIMHRQENLLNPERVKNIIQTVIDAAENMMCLFVMHEMTRNVLARMNLLQKIEATEGVVVANRMPYIDFISLLDASQFIVTDGGGNQQECYYLGKPCLLLRNVTEGREGLGGNVVVSRNDPDTIREFMRNYPTYKRSRIYPQTRPSQIIASTLVEAMGLRAGHAEETVDRV